MDRPQFGPGRYCSAPFARQAPRAAFSFDVGASIGSPCLSEIAIEHRFQGSDCWVQAGGASPMTAPGRVTIALEDLEEELRFVAEVRAAVDWEGFSDLIPSVRWIGE